MTMIILFIDLLKYYKILSYSEFTKGMYKIVCGFIKGKNVNNEYSLNFLA